MYNTTNKLDVSQIYHKWNLLFRLSNIFYRIRLYVRQAIGKSDIISPY